MGVEYYKEFHGRRIGFLTIVLIDMSFKNLDQVVGFDWLVASTTPTWSSTSDRLHSISQGKVRCNFDVKMLMTCDLYKSSFVLQVTSLVWSRSKDFTKFEGEDKGVCEVGQRLVSWGTRQAFLIATLDRWICRVPIQQSFLMRPSHGIY